MEGSATASYAGPFAAALGQADRGGPARACDKTLPMGPFPGGRCETGKRV